MMKQNKKDNSLDFTFDFVFLNKFAEDQITLPAKLPNVPHPEPVVFPHCIQVFTQSAEERAA
jgi:hypothetical protein